jgi:succinoglycan biosynthesis transport protein ExoP
MLSPQSGDSMEPRYANLFIHQEPVLTRVLDVLNTRKVTIAIVIAASLAIALSYLLAATPQYAATTQILVDTKRSHSDSVNADYSVDTAVVESQVQTIRSERIAAAVVQKLGLTDDADFTSPGPLARILELIGLGEDRASNSADAKRQAALATLKRGLIVSRVGTSYAVDILFSGPVPDKAARIANTVAEAYIEDQLNSRVLSTERANSWMRQRIDELRLKADGAAQALATFKAADHIIGDDLSRLDEEHQIIFRRLQSAAEASNRSYETFVNLDRFSRASQEQAFPFTEARVLSQASPPMRRSSPRVGLTLLFAFLTGSGLGLLAAHARDQLDPTIRTRSQIEQRLRVRSLGFIPYVASSRENAPLSFFAEGLSFSEALKTLKRVMAAIEDFDRSCPIIGIISANPGAGTTSVAFNLAKLMADADKRVLLIDGNVYDPSLTNNIAKEPHARRSHGSDDETALGGMTASHAGFYFLSLSSCSASPPIISARGSTSRSLSVMQEVLSAGRGRYDYVIVDLPSILEHAETGATAKLLDAVVIVASWGDTTSEELEQSISSHSIYSRLLGILVNKAPLRTFSNRHRRSRAGQA